MSGTSGLKRASSSRKSAKFNNRPGLYSLNEKELKTELKRIDLSKRQYETFFSHEQRKLITRFATKLIRSSSNLEIILNQEPGSNQPSPSPGGLKRGVSNLGFNHSTEELNLKPRPVTAIKPSIRFSDRDSDTSSIRTGRTESKVKKNVRWNADTFGKDLSESGDSIDLTTPLNYQNKNKATTYEINKKYDELKLKLADPQPKILLPQLISLNRRSNTELINIKRNPYAVLDDEDFKSENKDRFLNILQSEDSGFYSYKECLGYDNFRYLLKSAKNNPPKIKESEQGSKADQEKFKNPFYHVDIKPPQVKKPVQIPISNETNELNSQRSSRRNTISTNDEYEEHLREEEEDDQVCIDTFKAQNIRSLTFKQLVTY